jgi:hypothetical protein
MSTITRFDTFFAEQMPTVADLERDAWIETLIKDRNRLSPVGAEVFTSLMSSYTIKFNAWSQDRGEAPLNMRSHEEMSRFAFAMVNRSGVTDPKNDMATHLRSASQYQDKNGIEQELVNQAVADGSMSKVN